MKSIIIWVIIFQTYSFCLAQVDTIIWQNCYGVFDGENHSCAVEKTNNGYLLAIDVEEDNPSISNFHGISDAWIVKTDLVGNITWERCYGGSEGDSPVKIINIADDTYYLFNQTESSDGDVQNGRGGSFWVVKIDSTGNIIWENSYGGAIEGENFRDAILLPDKSVVLMGTILSAGGDITQYFGSDDIWICRIDSSGSIIWQNTYGNLYSNFGIKIKLTESNTVLCIGAYEKSGGMIDCSKIEDYNFDVWIFEIDLHGTMINQWCFGGTKHDQGTDIIDLHDGLVFLAGTNSVDGDINGFHGYEWTEATDIWVVKFDYSGTLIWQKCLGGSSYDLPSYLQRTNDSAYLIIGETMSFDGDVIGNHSLYDFYSDIWVIKLSSDGQLEWNHCFGGEGTEKFWGLHSVLKIDDYNYVVGANANYLDQDVQCDLFPNDLQNNAWIFEIKDCDYYFPAFPSITSGPETLCSTIHPVSDYSTGQSQWAEEYEWSLEPASAGDLIFDSTHAQITWNPQFEGLATITSRSYNDCGYSEWSEPKFTMVYPCMGVENDKGTGGQGDRGRLVIFPNPASGGLSVKVLGLSAGLNYSTFNLQPSITIYDVFGRKALSPCPLVSLSPGQNGVDRGWQIDVSALPPGIYFVVVRDDKTVIGSGKFVVAR